LVAVTRERRYGPSRLRVNDDDDVPLSPSFGTGRRVAMPCKWEGNRSSGATLAVRHRFKWFINLRAQVLRKGDEHSAYAPLRRTAHFTLLLYLTIKVRVQLPTSAVNAALPAFAAERSGGSRHGLGWA